jgi:hypothetical protein
VVFGSSGLMLPTYFKKILFGFMVTGAVMDNQRIREELAPALMLLYSSCHAVRLHLIYRGACDVCPYDP